jgi:hypothetical protein
MFRLKPIKLYEEIPGWHINHKILMVFPVSGDRVSTVVMVLRYKSEGRMFDPRWHHWNFSLILILLIAL